MWPDMLSLETCAEDEIICVHTSINMERRIDTSVVPARRDKGRTTRHGQEHVSVLSGHDLPCFYYLAKELGPSATGRKDASSAIW